MPQQTSDAPDYASMTRIRPSQAASIIGVSVSTLARWRKEKGADIGLPFFKTSKPGKRGGKVFYFKEQVAEFLKKGVVLDVGNNANSQERGD